MFLQLYIAVYYELLLIQPYTYTNYIKCDQIVALIISAIWYSSMQCHVCMESAQLYMIATTCACKATFSRGEATMPVKLSIIVFSNSHNFTYLLAMLTDFTYYSQNYYWFNAHGESWHYRQPIIQLLLIKQLVSYLSMQNLYK